MMIRLFCYHFIYILIASTHSFGSELPLGAGSFIYKDTKSISVSPIKVWFFNPSKSRKKRVLFVMHGIERNGETYRNSWIHHAKQGEYLLLVPEFSKQEFPDSEQYNLGNMYSQSGTSQPRSKWTFTTIENLFDYVKTKNKLGVTSYDIYGHSAGAQFVHRFVLFLSLIHI